MNYYDKVRVAFKLIKIASLITSVFRHRWGIRALFSLQRRSPLHAACTHIRHQWKIRYYEHLEKCQNKFYDNRVDSASSTCSTPHTVRKQWNATFHRRLSTLCMNSWKSRHLIKCTTTCKGNCHFWMPGTVTFWVISQNYIPSHHRANMSGYWTLARPQIKSYPRNRF